MRHLKQCGREKDGSAKLRKIERGGFKKPSKASKNAKKQHPGYGEKAPQTEIEDSGDLNDEQMDGDSDVDEPRQVVYRESTMYDDLLKKLGSRNVSIADALRRRCWNSSKQVQGRPSKGLIGDNALPYIEPREPAIVLSRVARDFKLKPRHLNQLPTFRGRVHENPLSFIREFTSMVATMPFSRLSTEDRCMICFPHRLEGEAKIWYLDLAPRSLKTWEMRPCFSVVLPQFKMRPLKGCGRQKDGSAELRKIERGEFKKSSKASKSAKNKHPGYGEKAPQTEIEDAGDLNDEEMDGDSDVDEPRQVAYREPTMYDDLLKKLGSRNVSVADALKRRQREEQGESETDEDEDSGPESTSESEEKDDIEDEDGNNWNRNYSKYL
ncbi:hypothetical protein CASFOL_030628 [Castilleja foliolosa]|uniref:Retrotransposon gag domain-containing protein n=1 Tax=Castilleja foliolosa TaxID=1961234 RepID=A0ABD3C6V6_9LAMI